MALISYHLWQKLFSWGFLSPFFMYYFGASVSIFPPFYLCDLGLAFFFLLPPISLSLFLALHSQKLMMCRYFIHSPHPFLLLSWESSQTKRWIKSNVCANSRQRESDISIPNCSFASIRISSLFCLGDKSNENQELLGKPPLWVLIPPLSILHFLYMAERERETNGTVRIKHLSTFFLGTYKKFLLLEGLLWRFCVNNRGQNISAIVKDVSHK